MTTDYNFYIFSGLVLLLAANNARHAQPVSRARSVYQLTDRPSWIAGAVMAILIAYWRPWFVDAWWKVLIFAPILGISMASFSQLVIGRFFQSRDDEHTVTTISRFLTLGTVAGVVFLVLRSCG